MAAAIALAHEHPLLGQMVSITDPTAPLTFVAPVDIHLGRYFYAGGFRFHVADDYRPMGDRRIWKTAAATAVLLAPGEVSAMPVMPVAAPPEPAAAPVTGISVTEPIEFMEPSELWYSP